MRWSKLYDIRATVAWGKVNSMAVYMYIVTLADQDTSMLRTTYRRMIMDLRLTLGALRYALRNLQDAGLIEVEMSGRYMMITLLTELAVVRPRIDDCLPILQRHAVDVAQVLAIGVDTCTQLAGKFAALQRTAGKTWTDERDVVSHFTNWLLRNGGSRGVIEDARASARAAAASAPIGAAPAPSVAAKRAKEKAEAAMIRDSWVEAIRDARVRAQSGDTEALEYLEKPMVKVMMQKYNL